ncbi:hypothetical protein JZ751_028491 [Albula glossodonta]|uniref:Uncharacterized protein n=1 Tax=Albula glossodonta TaxID=121402 RepID=A0A8T2NAY4_9TELE|nr:hypothetical protein JZ751_028491 [Albula glossodonta]
MLANETQRALAKEKRESAGLRKKLMEVQAQLTGQERTARGKGWFWHKHPVDGRRENSPGGNRQTSSPADGVGAALQPLVCYGACDKNQTCERPREATESPRVYPAFAWRNDIIGVQQYLERQRGETAELQHLQTRDALLHPTTLTAANSYWNSANIDVEDFLYSAME